MHKIFCMLAMLLCLTGCSNKEDALPVSEQVEVVKEIQTETQVPTISVAERAELLRAENLYIHDEDALLSETEFELYNGYLDSLQESHGINAVVVITSHLDGNAPADFAKAYYQALFGDTETNGFLLLINNDSNQDVYYLSGTCRQDISDEEIHALLVKATPCLVEERYADALEILLSFRETLPLHETDIIAESLA